MSDKNNYISQSNKNEDIQLQRDSFIVSLSHDLKNPTIAQIRAIELILEGKFGKLPPEQREIMEMVLYSCKYMNAMLKTVLTTYRNENGTINLASDELSIAEIASECKDEMIYLAKEKNVQIVYKNSASKTIIYGDKIQIRRVIMNLLSNGIKYAYPKTKMFIEVYNEMNYTCFQFKNKSPYIPPKKADAIFARYVTLSDGIGLGLYVSKKIVEAHDGKMFIHSNKKDENIFGFKIPNQKIKKKQKRTLTF